MKESDLEHVFHFTRSIESLNSIINNEIFWVCYSLENFDFLNNGDPWGGQINKSFAYPMTCFCDIPLDERIFNHANDKSDGYGRFGIGMKKSWAEKMGIAPVHYVTSNNIVAKLWSSILFGIPNMRNWTKESGNFDFFFNDLINLGTFIKPYKNIDSKIYYDEREWRYYPPLELFEEMRIKRFLTEEEYKNANREGSMQSGFELQFSLEQDVDYLIVPLEYIDEVYRLINGLKIKIQPYEEIGIK